MKIGILGSGSVATTLGAGFLKHGHAVMLGTRDPKKLADFQARHAAAKIGPVADAAAFGEVLVLAVKGDKALDVLAAAGDALNGKAVLDATNPIAPVPPQNGVLAFFTTLGDSLMERLQRAHPAVRFVKCFSSVGSARMVDPAFAAGKPTMFICGNDEAAKQTAAGILDQFGWETLDMGGAEAARAIEPLCILWCIQGFRAGEWTHAFKVLHG
jgi:predicted dinucleotide-binding enzyme